MRTPASTRGVNKVAVAYSADPSSAIVKLRRAEASENPQSYGGQVTRVYPVNVKTGFLLLWLRSLLCSKRQGYAGHASLRFVQNNEFLFVGLEFLGGLAKN